MGWSSAFTPEWSERVAAVSIPQNMGSTFLFERSIYGAYTDLPRNRREKDWYGGGNAKKANGTKYRGVESEMPKVGMQPIRRVQLIEATLQSVHRYGLSDTTVARIGDIAGVSTGIIAHYFGGKNELIEATMREILKTLGRDVREQLRVATTPRQRIEAIINGDFAFEQVDKRSVTTWPAFWSQAMHVPELARLQAINMRRLQSNLVFYLRGQIPSERVHLVANGLAALIDGLWLRGAFEPSGVDVIKAKRVCMDYLECNCIAARAASNE